MKIPSLAAAFVLVSFTSASAITDADIAPAALVGKTLTFTIVNGGSPYATNGVWSGTFANSGNAFTVANVSGDTVPITTTFSAAVDSGFTNVSLAKFIEGQKPATLTLYTVSGVGNYEVSIQDLFGVSLNGTFTIGSAPAKGPEIDVRPSKGGALTDGTSKIRFSAVQVSKTGAAKTFIIKNAGSGTLKNLDIIVDGKNKADFLVSTLKKTELADGESTGFTVRFKPAAFGTRKAALHIKSNDKNESSFDIDLSGSGVGIK